ncbi:hypothetical protein Tco_1105719 [Tanacetum coccineum]
MSSPKFAEMHNVVAFLEKPAESDGFAEIIDFLKASSVHYALTVQVPLSHTSYIEQFWATAKVKTVNDVRQIQALIDKKKLIITETSIRSDLHLEDKGGTNCLPSATIFEELARMGAKSTTWNEFSSTMASLIICLATNQKFNLFKYIFDAMLGDMSHHKKIYVNPSHTKKFFANMKKEGKDFSRRITPLFDTMMVQASEEVGEDSDHPTDSNQIPIVDQPSTSSLPKKKQKSKRKQRKEVEVAHDEAEHEESVLDLEKAKSDQAIEIASLNKRVDKLEKRRKFRTTGLKRLKKFGAATRIESSNDILDDDEMFVDATTSEKNEQCTKIDDSSVGEAVTTTGVEDSTAPTIQVSTADIRDEGVTSAKIDELTLA